MAAIYLEHPLHGTKVACSDAEAKYDETNGWKRFTVPAISPARVLEPAPVPAPEAVQADDDAVENKLTPRRRRAPV